MDTSSEVLDSGGAGAGAGRTVGLWIAGAAALGALWLPATTDVRSARPVEREPAMPTELFEITLPNPPRPTRGCLSTADAAARTLAAPSRLHCVRAYRQRLAQARTDRPGYAIASPAAAGPRPTSWTSSSAPASAW